MQGNEEELALETKRKRGRNFEDNLKPVRTLSWSGVKVLPGRKRAHRKTRNHRALIGSQGLFRGD
jgi:hypothetical protein